MKRLTIAIRGRSEGEWFSCSHFQRLEVRGRITSSLTSVCKDNMILEIYETAD